MNVPKGSNCLIMCFNNNISSQQRGPTLNIVFLDKQDGLEGEGACCKASEIYMVKGGNELSQVVL